MNKYLIPGFALLTGKHSHANGQRTNEDVFDGSQQTFPKLLQENGYQTALIGKWHQQSDPTGFDYWNILPGQETPEVTDILQVEDIKLNLEKETARFLKVTARNFGVIPPGHPGEGDTAWLFVDEIIVE